MQQEKRQIIYPIFIKCCEFIDDPFWENIFYNLSFGKTPYGTYISKDFLCCNYKSKEFSYKIEIKEPSKIYNEIYNLLTNKLGLYSCKEITKKRTEFFEYEDNINESKYLSWCNIKKKNVKDMLIEKFVIEMKDEYMLSYKQARYVLSIIYIALIFKVITTKDINYNDGKIISICGLEFSHKKVILTKNLYNIEEFNDNIESSKTKMYYEWDKYLKDIKKNL
jgi:hypothetical protein